MVLLLLPALIGLLREADEGLDRARIQALHDAFVSNGASIPFGHIEFRFVTGTSRTAARARRVEFDTQYEARGAYVFAGEKARYEILYNDADKAATTQVIGPERRVMLESFRITADEHNTLYDDSEQQSRTALLSPGKARFHRDFQFPLSLGQPEPQRIENLGWYLRAALNNDPKVRISQVEDAEYEARPVTRVVFELEDETITYWVDTQRGAVPLRILDQYREPGESHVSIENEFVFDDIRKIPGRGWLPFVQTSWFQRGGNAKRIELRETDFSRESTTADFDLHFPKPTALIDAARKIRYDKQTTWNLSNLPSSVSPRAQKIEYSALPSDLTPRMAGERKSGREYRLLIVGVAALLIAMALVVLNRRRSA